MSKVAFEKRKKAIKDQLRWYLAGRTEIGLSDVKRNLSNAFARTPTAPLVEQGLFVAKMLNAVGWQRDGWLYTGYDRTPRYVCAIVAKLRRGDEK